jgi:putative ABC transport system permease protein
MRQQDFIRLIGQSIVAHRLRSSLTALGIGIGVTAVVLLTAIGEGLNTYMVGQFTQFGTTTLAVQPGKTSTLGFAPGVLNSVRPLSLQDAEAV